VAGTVGERRASMDRRGGHVLRKSNVTASTIEQEAERENPAVGRRFNERLEYSRRIIRRRNQRPL